MTTIDSEKLSAYTVRPDRIEARGRSSTKVIGERLCPTALAKLHDPGDRGALSFKQMRDLARKECSGDPDYLTPLEPVLETAFKLLLLAPGDKLDLKSMHNAISDLWMTSARPRHISIEALARVLDRDTYYGIVRLDK